MTGLEEYEGDKLPSGARFRERYTSRGPVPELVQPEQPSGMAIRQFNKSMDDLNENLIQRTPFLGPLVNAQVNGEKGNYGRMAGDMAMFGVDLATTVTTGGESRTLLSKNMIAAGLEKAEGFEAHHIVAFADTQASAARAILEKAGIGINDAINGVFLKGPKVANEVEGIAHRAIHTRAYYEEITNRLRNSQNVRETLTQIGKGIAAGTFPY